MNTILKSGGGSASINDAIDKTSDSLQTSEQNPIYEHNENSPHFIDVQNIADTNTHYAYLEWRTFKNGSLQFIFGGTDTITVKVAVSNEGDTDPTAATYTNTSTEILGASSITSDQVVFLDSSIACVFLRVEYTSNNLASDGSLQVLTYKQY